MLAFVIIGEAPNISFGKQQKDSYILLFFKDLISVD